jgi:hypothetical protein
VPFLLPEAGQGSGDAGSQRSAGLKITAVSQLLYPGAAVAKWHLPQENATFRDAGKGT